MKYEAKDPFAGLEAIGYWRLLSIQSRCGSGSSLRVFGSGGNYWLVSLPSTSRGHQICAEILCDSILFNSFFCVRSSICSEHHETPSRDGHLSSVNPPSQSQKDPARLCSPILIHRLTISYQEDVKALAELVDIIPSLMLLSILCLVSGPFLRRQVLNMGGTDATLLYVFLEKKKALHSRPRSFHSHEDIADAAMHSVISRDVLPSNKKPRQEWIGHFYQPCQERTSNQEA